MDEIVKETQCKRLEVKKETVDYKYLIEKRVPDKCDEFKQEILKLDLKFDGISTEPDIPRPQKANTKLIVIICTLVGVIGLGLSLKFLHNRKTQMARRRCASTT